MIEIIEANSSYIPLPSDSASCVVTSPPYWSLRDYDTIGQLGLEETPEKYVENLVAVFREVKRVLHPQGTLWLNLGDCYNGSGGAGGDYNPGGLKEGQPRYPGRRVSSLKPKDLVGIPWTVAFALRAEGWYLRSEIIWNKPDGMPEGGAHDRPTKAHETVFLFSKSEKYFCDRIGAEEAKIGQALNSWRAVWTIKTSKYKGAHFATFPVELVTACLIAGTSRAGMCPVCGRQWVRVIERQPRPANEDVIKRMMDKGIRSRQTANLYSPRNRNWSENRPKTLGWVAACRHDQEPVRPLVIDPFSGTGTTGVAAIKLNCQYIGLELSPKYITQSLDRLDQASKDHGGDIVIQRKTDIQARQLQMFAGGSNG